MNRKLATEFLGTFFLVTIVITSGNGFAIGVGLAALIYLGGHISGAHYNPAVSLAMTLAGQLRAAELIPYLGAQFAGAGAAFGVGLLLDLPDGVAQSVSFLPGFTAELLFTFLLITVIFQVAIAPSQAGNQFFGLAIGGTVLSGAYAVGSISGGVFNPAVGVGLLLDGKLKFLTVLTHFGAQTLAAFAAAAVYRILSAPAAPEAPEA